MKRKSIFRKVTALMCCLAMLFTTFMPVYAEGNVPAASMDISALSGKVTFYTDEEYSEIKADSTYEWGTNYRFTVTGNVITFIALDTTTWVDKTISGETIVFYAKTDDGSKVEIRCGSGQTKTEPVEDTDQSAPEGAQWKITVTFNNLKPAVTGVTLTPSLVKSQYDVTFSDGDQYEIFVGNDLVNGETIKYEEGTKLEFAVRLADGINANTKQVTVRNGASVIEADSETGKYTVKVEGKMSIRVTVTDIKFTITGPQGTTEGFTYIPTSDEGVGYNGTFTFTVTPEPGRAKPAVTISGTSSPLQETTENNYVIRNIKSNITIEITAGNANTYTVDLPTGTGYTATMVSETTEFGYGAEAKFTVEAKNGYRIDAVRVGTQKLTPAADGKTYTVKVTGNIEVTVMVSKASYSVKYEYTPSNNFSVSDCVNEEDVEYLSTCTFVVTPAAGYNAPVVKMTVNDGEATTLTSTTGSYTFTVRGNTVITIEEPTSLTYNVTLVDGNAYTLTSDNKTVAHGGTVVVTLKVADHYSARALNVLAYVNGTRVACTVAKVEEDKEYTVTIENVTGALSVSAEGLQEKQYTVELVPGAGYTLSTTGSTSLLAGSTFNFTVTVLPGYTGTAKVVVNETETFEVTSENYYFTITVEGNTTIKVTGLDLITFEPKVEVDDEEAAKVTSEMTVVPYGGTYMFTVTANYGYRVDKVLYNGNVLTDANGKYTITNVTAEIDIDVVTVKNVLTINYVSEEKNHHYTDTVKYYYGDEIKFVVLDSCSIHSFFGWTLGTGEKADATALMSRIESSDDTVTLTASFEFDTTEVVEKFKLLQTYTVLKDGQKGYSSRVLFRTVAQAAEELLSDKCVAESVKVTALGTLLSNNADAFSDTNAITAHLHARNTESTERSEFAVGDYRVFNYFNNCEQTLADLDGKYLELAINTDYPNSLYSVGWMELDIAGTKVIIVSEANAPVSNDN